MGEPVLESAYYVAAGYGPRMEVFLVENGRLEAASQAGHVAWIGGFLLAVRDAVGWALPSGSPGPRWSGRSSKAATRSDHARTA
jgi:hypothetical protein